MLAIIILIENIITINEYVALSGAKSLLPHSEWTDDDGLTVGMFER
jgi:hypothetical protein